MTAYIDKAWPTPNGPLTAEWITVTLGIILTMVPAGALTLVNDMGCVSVHVLVTFTKLRANDFYFLIN